MPIISPTLPNDGETIDASDVNNPFNAILAVINGGIDSNNIAAGGVTLAQLAGSLTPFLVPTGSIVPFGGSAAPTGWLFCDGSSQLRASYPALFAALGTNYGSVDGTHFNLPDLAGRVPVGREAMSGATTNRNEHSTTITTTSGSPTATVVSATNLAVGMYIKSTNVPALTTILTIVGTTITMSANASATAGGTAVRFSMVVDAQVLGSAGGTDVQTLITAQLASHTHTLSQNATSTAGGLASWYAGNGAGSSAPTTSATGSDQPHPNIQPSQVVNYIIKI